MRPGGFTSAGTLIDILEQQIRQLERMVFLKYIVVLADGMADYPIEQLGGKTPLQAASTPCIDRLARLGTIGLVQTVPLGMNPGSDTANLSVMGYDPRQYYSGRSPFEAYSIGIPMTDEDVSFRCNLVTVTEEEPYEEKTILDHSSGEISSEEAAELITAIQAKLGRPGMTFYPGISYRHILLWEKGPWDYELVPPHDILGKKIGPYQPKGPYGELLESMMRESYGILSEHPVNRKRKARGLNPGNLIWLWGEGKKPSIQSFKEKYGLEGAVISAVDLIKGLGLCAGMESIDVDGVTGTYETNYEGKTTAALEALARGKDFIYIHLEGPDECGHRAEIEHKVTAIERIDRLVVKPIVEALDAKGEDYRLMVLPDHATPIAVRTHTMDPIPFMIYDSRKAEEKDQTYDEDGAKQTGVLIEKGYTLMDRFLKGDGEND